MTTKRIGEAGVQLGYEGHTAPVPSPRGAGDLCESGYGVRFARNEGDVERVLRLRFEVFNQELGEGLAESWGTGLDRDPYDAVCHHLMLTDMRTGELVGTYRMQTFEMARDGIGFYSAQEFDLSGIPSGVIEQAVEVGRACIRRQHRNGHALFALWRGLSLYMIWSGKRHLFGCCSLTSQDPRAGSAMLRMLERENRMCTEYSIRPQPAHELAIVTDDALPEVEMPRLFGTYLRYGAVALGPPAIDRAFGTIDFLVALDLAELSDRLRKLFFVGLEGALDREDA